MLPDALRNFPLNESAPAFLSFISHATAQSDLEFRVAWDGWDFYGFEETTKGSKPKIAVRLVDRGPTPRDIQRLTTDPTPVKVLFVEGNRPNYTQLQGLEPFFKAAGVHVYVAGSAQWLYGPENEGEIDREELRYKLAPRWKKDEKRGWIKKCTTCGEWKGPDDYYDHQYKTNRDPKRHTCKVCMNEKSRSRRKS